MATTKLRVVFAYRALLKARGSKIMRSDQLCAMARLHLGHLYDFEQVMLHGPGKPRQQRKMVEHLRGAVVIFLKGSARNFDEAGMASLRDAAHAICVDYLDSPVGGAVYPYTDTHIMASLAGQAALTQRLAHSTHWPGAHVAYLTHHADPRLGRLREGGPRAMRVGYFGLAANTYIPPALAGRVIAAPEAAAFNDLLSAMEATDLHYAIRNPAPLLFDGQRLFKPFTKGFNAARIGANVVVDRAADDAVAYLGDDYPFFAASTDEPDIIAAFQVAEDTFGGPEWQRALDRMAHVKARSGTDQVMADLRQILARFH